MLIVVMKPEERERESEQTEFLPLVQPRDSFYKEASHGALLAEHVLGDARLGT